MITGAIALSGNSEFAVKGSSMSMAFENAATVKLTSEGASWRTWDAIREDRKTAEVFRFIKDPGPLQNGTTLCSSGDKNEQLYAVFYEDSSFGLPPKLHLAVFQSVEPPHDINSPGLCGTYNYEIEPLVDTTYQHTVSETNSAEVPGTSAWNLHTGTNPIDDTTTVTLTLAAEKGTSQQGDPVTFVARCKSNKTEAYVVWGDFLGDDSKDVYSNWKNVTIRIGAGDARDERWGVSTDRKATFSPGWAGSLLKKLLGNERLVLQTIPYGENPNTAVFDVTGLSSVLGVLSGTCNWSY